ncbi:MAG: sugar kinase [Deltaproteobacteria bacterium]|nr:sugar kinase [Deltaproteobacteria bacterium]
MSLLVVGSVAFDGVETPFGKRDKVLGGSATFFSTSATNFTPVRLVAVVGNDFPEEHIDYLKSRGVDTKGLVRDKDGKTFFWRGKYDFNLNNCETLETQLNVFANFSPVLPDGFRDSEYVFLANIDPVLQLKVLDQVQKPKLVAMDTMNFWITGKRNELVKVLERVDMLMINDSEARQLSGEHNLVRAAKKIRAMGPKHLMLKQGEYGALLFSGDEVFRAPAYPLESVFDPTGAGDSFAGGVMGYLAANGAGTSELKQAVIAGSVLASFVVEDFSIDRFRRLNTNDIQERFKAFHKLTHFDDTLRLPKV